MRRLTFAVLLMLGFAVLQADMTMAQQRNPTRSRGGAEFPRRSLNRRFEARGPAVGEMVPDVSFFDADGNKLSLHSLKGKYTVLVFGCLT